MPIGHAIDFGLQVDSSTYEVIKPSADYNWLVRPLEESIKSGNVEKLTFERSKIHDVKKAVIINCLDNCFGHVFTKLWNACFEYGGYAKIVLIPKQCRWLVPGLVAEVWTVDIPVSSVQPVLPGLHDEIKKAISDFEEVVLHPAYVHLDHSKVPLQKLVKIPRFDLKEFSNRSPRIGFVLREDRFWLDSDMLEKAYLACRKFKVLGKFRFVFLWRQKLLVERFYKIISKEIPDVEMYVSGLGNTGRFIPEIEDLRVDDIHSESEIERNSIYGKTHLILGIHGSHLLVPSALAAGYVNINPRYKTAHWIEDTVLPYKNRMQQFLGRKLDQKTSPALLAHHVIRILSDFPYVYRRLNE